MLNSISHLQEVIKKVSSKNLIYFIYSILVQKN